MFARPKMTLKDRLQAFSLLRQQDDCLYRGQLPQVHMLDNPWYASLIFHGIVFVVLAMCAKRIIHELNALIPFLHLNPEWFWLPYVFYYLSWFFLHIAFSKRHGERNHKALKRLSIIYLPMRLLFVWLCKCFKRYNYRYVERTWPFVHTKGAVLWLGQSSGDLALKWHQSGMASQQAVSLPLEDACKNILVLGGTGSGKTTGVMQPLLAQALMQDFGLLLFDIKGDVQAACQAMAKALDKANHITVIGPHRQALNLTEGLSPHTIASFLKSTFLLNGHTLESFWIDTASELCRHTLGLLQHVPEHYHLKGLHDYLFNPDVRDGMDQQLQRLQGTLHPEQQRLLDNHQHYLHDIFAHFDDKVKSNVKATVSQVLSPFCDPHLVDAFCTPQCDTTINHLLDGHTYIVDVPLSEWGLAAKVVYTFIKLRFFNLMQSRHRHPIWNQQRPVMFMCDEYQEIISAHKDGLSDLNFWDKSRASKTIGVISSQSISSFYAAVGQPITADAILQNFRQRLLLPTEDEATIQWINRLAGLATVHEIQTTEGQGQSQNTSRLGKNKSANINKTIVKKQQAVIDAPYIRKMLPGEALAFLTIQGKSMDDLLFLKPLYMH